MGGRMQAYFQRNNYRVADAGREVITFEGDFKPERGAAAYITFCTVLGLLSLGLVVSIAVPSVGDKAYWIAAISPLAGAYYWKAAGRIEEVKVKMVTSDDELTTDIVVEGPEEELESMRKELEFNEKGMILIKGILESDN